MVDVVHMDSHWLLLLNMQICVFSLSYFAQTVNLKHHLFELFGFQLVFLHFLSFIEKILKKSVSSEEILSF